MKKIRQLVSILLFFFYIIAAAFMIIGEFKDLFVVRLMFAIMSVTPMLIYLLKQFEKTNSILYRQRAKWAVFYFHITVRLSYDVEPDFQTFAFKSEEKLTANGFEIKSTTPTKGSISYMFKTSSKTFHTLSAKLDLLQDNIRLTFSTGPMKMKQMSEYVELVDRLSMIFRDLIQGDEIKYFLKFVYPDNMNPYLAYFIKFEKDHSATLQISDNIYMDNDVIEISDNNLLQAKKQLDNVILGNKIN